MSIISRISGYVSRIVKKILPSANIDPTPNKATIRPSVNTTGFKSSYDKASTAQVGASGLKNEYGNTSLTSGGTAGQAVTRNLSYTPSTPNPEEFQVRIQQNASSPTGWSDQDGNPMIPTAGTGVGSSQKANLSSSSSSPFAPQFGKPLNNPTSTMQPPFQKNAAQLGYEKISSLGGLLGNPSENYNPYTGKYEGGQMSPAGMGLGGGELSGMLGGMGKEVGGAAMGEFQSSVQKLIQAISKEGEKVLTGNTKAAVDAAAGKIPKGFVKEAGTGFIVKNGVTEKLMGSYLGKVISKTYDPRLVAGLLVTGVVGSGIFTTVQGPNEKGDAITQLNIMARDAADSGDTEFISQIDDLMREVQAINAAVPFKGYFQANKAKIDAGALAVQKELERAQEVKAGIDQETLDRKRDEEYWKGIEQAKEESRIRQRNEDTAYYQEMDRVKSEQTKKEQEELRNFWEDYEMQKQENAKATREEERVYYENLRKQQLAQRQADEEYWKQVKKQKEEEAPSKLKFGLLK